MIKNSIVHVLLVVLTNFCVVNLNAQSSRKINVKNANSLEFDNRTEAQRLVGEVVFEHQGTLLYCDSAYLFPDNRLDAYSNVRILSDSVTATGKQLNYDGNTRIAKLSGNVVMTDPNSRLTTEFLTYDLENKSAGYSTGGKITSKSNELVSVFGQYKSTNRTFYFRKNVKLINPQYVMESDTLHYSTVNETAYFIGPTTITSKENKIYCENGYYNTKTDKSEFGKNARFESGGQLILADTLRYDRITGMGRARKNVAIFDTTEKVTLRGDYANYNEKTGAMLITQEAEMEKPFGKDTLYLHADTLRSILDTTIDKRTIYAYHRAQFYKADFQGRCDSLTYAESDTLMRLFKDPIIWNEENQLIADTILIQLANNKLHTLYLIKSGFISSQVDSLHFDQIKGKTITGYFTDNELSRVLVEGNGETIYFAEDQDSSYIGVNKAVCSRMLIHFDSSAIKSIVFYTQPEATLFPLKDLNEETMKLKGFQWFGEVRPKNRFSIFEWKALAPRVTSTRKRAKQ
jgi:lipopolysaccharide export system protein LptA